jgi:predicted HTH transcriptional regulator
MTTVQQPFDRERVPNAHFTDLDLALVEQTMRQGSETGRYTGPLDPRACLARYGGVSADGEALHPTVAGVLAFTHEPERWLTASGIDIALYRADQTSPIQSRPAGA